MLQELDYITIVELCYITRSPLHYQNNIILQQLNYVSGITLHEQNYVTLH